MGSPTLLPLKAGHDPTPTPPGRASPSPSGRYLAVALATSFLLYLLPIDLVLLRPFALLADALFAERYCDPSELASGIGGQWVPWDVDAHTWPRLKASVGYGFCHDANRTALSCSAAAAAAAGSGSWTERDARRRLEDLAGLNGWGWEPEGCAVRPFNPETLLERLALGAKSGKSRAGKGSGILFVGGESARRQAQSLECLLGRYVDRGNILDEKRGTVRLEGGAGNIDFVWNDALANPVDWTLVLPEEEECSSAHNTTSECWTRLARGKEFVVVNSGETLLPLTPTRFARYTNIAKQVIQFIDTRSHATLIVRSSVPPLPLNCTDPVLGVNQTQAALDAAARDIDSLNTVWKDLLWDHPRHLFLDVTSIMGALPVRRSSHTCLRDCLPGPVDTWNVLLAHMILQSR
ncbi:hypothetical protein JCM8202_000940 [Rhodotorula sphaerocarpa]